MHQKETLCDFVSETCFVSAPFGEIEPVELVEILAPILWMMCLILKCINRESCHLCFGNNTTVVL